jgi:hypothetical protein
MSVLRTILIFALLLGCGAGNAVRATAQQDASAESTAVEQGRKALDGRTYFPFYDAKQDDVRRLDVKTSNEAANIGSNSKWEDPNKATTTPFRPARGGTSFASFFQIAGLALLTILIIGITVALINAFLRTEQSQTQGAKFIDTSSDVDRVEDLPFQIKKPTGDFLSEARRLYEEGRYSEAIVYLFSYQLVALDKRHVIRLAKGKTNRQYLRETRSREPIKQILHGTMISFEDVFFGHHQLSREHFEENWQQLDEFHRQLEQLEVAA